MAAVTADRQTKTKGTPLEETYIIATSQTLYIGAMVNFVASTGRVTNATAATSRRFAGIVVDLPDGSATGNTAGTVRAKIAWGHMALLNVATAARTFGSLTKNVFVSSNQDVTDQTAAGTSAVQVKVGTLVKFEASDKSTGWVLLREFSDTNATGS